MEQAHAVLRDTFGFPGFRHTQEEVIQRLLVENDNALVLFPTGGGKSLCYQVPALCLDGLTLVISPLIALMKDQVDALVNRNVKAASLDSTLTADRSAWVKQEVLSGSMKMLYVAPERLNNESFVAMMRKVKISLLAVDESHCISQWGASFRPEYLKIARFAEELDVERVLCLTATATKTVAEDICKSFFIHPTEGVFRIPVYRPNLALRAHVANNMNDKVAHVLPMLQSRTGPVIIYVTLQKQAEEIADRLRPHGLEPMVYHAGLPAEERERIQMQFMESDRGIVCATIAFGMGIDKANIRQVIHFHMPKTLENYSQEVGRAGRDGLESTCLMFLSAADIPVLEGFARGDTCAKRDIELWLQEVAMAKPAPDGTIDFNHYHQAKIYDIRQNVLNLSFAELELDHGYIRAVTPYYSVYDISARTNDGWKKVTSDRSKQAQALKACWIAKGTGYQIDMAKAAEYSKINRADLARYVSEWEFAGYINCKASQVRARYQVLKPLPKAPEEIQALADQLFTRMLAREEESVQKLRQVMEFATNDDCLAHALASYFGDDDAVPNQMCGKCSFCLSGSGVEFAATASCKPDPRQIQAILNACTVRDDPRLLARMAFGITSPRLTVNKWSAAHPLFGSMVQVDFNALVEAFEKECKKVGYVNLEPPSPPPKTAQKRSYTQYSSYGSRSSSGGSSYRGGYSKRARGRRY
ncbi:ATP-dependent DNA helicase [Fomitopsis serialis]|uniref:ATP-dependent DNA helicase n=1 Tax=Fomitopsis serialis TaxID=139415 RepID=UPI00200817EB|nr:ATP-dependent DNA helicase [Neoantrodia serialis]KAH9937035.1 ATP-dependent DNA helicase [Neoantrodia serialis]